MPNPYVEIKLKLKLSKSTNNDYYKKEYQTKDIAMGLAKYFKSVTPEETGSVEILEANFFGELSERKSEKQRKIEKVIKHNTKQRKVKAVRKNVRRRKKAV